MSKRRKSIIKDQTKKDNFIIIPKHIIQEGVKNNIYLMTYIYLMYRKNGNDGVEFSKKSYYSFMGIKKPQLKKQADIILGDILEKYSNAIINIVDLSLNDLINIKLNVVDSKKKFKELHPEKNVFKFAKIYFDEIDLIIEQEKKSELSVSAKKIFLFLSYHRLKMIKRNGALVETAPEISYFRINDLSEQINISMRTISRMLKILSDIKIIKTNQTKTLKIPDTTFFIKGYIIVADYHSRDIKYSAEENLKYGVEYVNNKLNERRKL